MANRTTLNISLPLELGEFIQQRVASGRYASASEVVRAALRLLEECEGQQVPEPVAQRHYASTEKPSPGAPANG